MGMGDEVRVRRWMVGIRAFFSTRMIVDGGKRTQHRRSRGTGGVQ